MGKGGDVAVAAGNSYTGDGGALVLQGGYSEFGNGGDVIMDAGDSGTGDSTKEGLIRIAPTSASFVRIGRSGSKTVRTDVFGDLTVHGSFVSTSSMVYQDTYTERVHISTEQDQMIQEEMRVPKITGLDSEDVAGDPTSTLTLGRRAGRNPAVAGDRTLGSYPNHHRRTERRRRRCSEPRGIPQRHSHPDQARIRRG